MTVPPLRSILSLAAVVLTSCSSSPPVRYYALPVVSAPAEEAAVSLRVELGPVQLPERLQRPQMFSRSGPVAVRYADGARWAEPLRTAVPAALAGQLARALAPAQVGQAGAPVAVVDPHWLIAIDFASLEADGDVLRVDARWRAHAPRGGRREGRSAFELALPATHERASAIALAHAQALERLAQDIAAGLRQAVRPEG